MDKLQAAIERRREIIAGTDDKSVSYMREGFGERTRHYDAKIAALQTDNKALREALLAARHIRT